MSWHGDIAFPRARRSSSTASAITTASYTLTFPEPGIYRVEIAGTFPRIFFNNGGDRRKILTVEQWGNIAWSSMDLAFFGCTNLTVPATDAPDLSAVTTMHGMFAGATSFNQPIDHWDVSNVTNIRAMFQDATAFNQPLNKWDTSAVTNTMRVFWGASSFNQPLDGWDTSAVTNMESMFVGASAFNQPLNNWNTSAVMSMPYMFYGAFAFNQPLNNWNMSKVTNTSFMFYSATAFNQPLNTWNTSKVTSMAGMFQGATTFDQDLSAWNIASTTNMASMFRNAGLSQANLDATLASWASQPVKPNVPFHLGLKTYSDTGATALATLRNTYNWTITEQYQAQYSAGTKATLLGSGTQSPLNSGASTTAVEVKPDRNCTFIEWSDGITDNPRQDVLTDNLTVSANISCRTTGTSAETQARKTEVFRNQSPSDSGQPETLADTLERVKTLPASLPKNLDPERDRDTIKELITVLLQLIEALGKLLVATSPNPAS